MGSEHRVDMRALSDGITPWAIRAAATLRLPDLMAGGVHRIEDLAGRAEADPDALCRLLRYLTVRGVFVETGPGEYDLTDAAAIMLTNHPYSRRHWLDDDGVAGRIEGSFIRLADSIRTGTPAYEKVYGVPFYDDLAQNPERAASFNALMATHAEYFDKVVEAFDWGEARTVVDVGGGSGALLTGILSANPQLHGTVVDLPGVVKQAEQRLADEQLSDRSDVVAGSIFEALPAGRDVYVLSNVLHDWDDESAVRILRRCAEAAGSTGRVLVVQILVAQRDNRPIEQGELEFITQMDLRLMVLMGGRERTWDEFATLADRAGMTISKSVQIETGQSLLTLVAK